MIDKLKGAVHSFTIWFNGILAAVMGALPILLESLPGLQQYVPDNIYKHLMLVALVGNMLLRFKTSKPLNEK